MPEKTVDEQFEKLNELQNEIGSIMHALLTENACKWDQARLLVEHRGTDHYRWGLLYREGTDDVAGIKTKQRFATSTIEYMHIISEQAGEQAKRLRFHLDTSLKFTVEIWYTPTEGLPGWNWEEETPSSGL